MGGRRRRRSGVGGGGRGGGRGGVRGIFSLTIKIFAIYGKQGTKSSQCVVSFMHDILNIDTETQLKGKYLTKIYTYIYLIATSRISANDTRFDMNY